MKKRFLILPYLFENFLCAMFLLRAYPLYCAQISVNFLLALSLPMLAGFAWSPAERQPKEKQLFLMLMCSTLLWSVLFCGWMLWNITGSVLRLDLSRINSAEKNAENL